MNWNYIAGFVDGEGCIKQYKFKQAANRNGHQNRGILSVTQKLDSSAVIDEIQRFLLDNGIPSTITITSVKNCTSMKTLRVQHRKYLFLLLDNLLPLLIVKREDATKVYSWLKGVRWNDY